MTLLFFIITIYFAPYWYLAIFFFAWRAERRFFRLLIITPLFSRRFHAAAPFSPFSFAITLFIIFTLRRRFRWLIFSHIFITTYAGFLHWLILHCRFHYAATFSFSLFILFSSFRCRHCHYCASATAMMMPFSFSVIAADITFAIFITLSCLLRH